ncbi:MAG: hypothetical protein SGPRY_012246, partial [Prymnesium sp.]
TPPVLQLDEAATRHVASIASKCSLLSYSRDDVLYNLDQHGAVLLRGWNVSSAAEFSCLLSMLGLSDNADYFPAEAGREPLLTGTGPRGVSPRVVAFWCERPSYLGGETLIVDGIGAFSALPRYLRKRLRSRHNMSFSELLAACEGSRVRARLIGERSRGRELCSSHSTVLELEFQKPSVVLPDPLQSLSSTPRARALRPSLCLNFSEFGFTARAALLETLLQRGLFCGVRWMPHLLLWRLALLWPLVACLLRLFDQLPGWLCSPLKMCTLVLEEWRISSASRCADAESLSPNSQQQASKAAGVVRNSSIGVEGEKGDVLAASEIHSSSANTSDNLGHFKREQSKPTDCTLGESLSDEDAEQLSKAVGENAVAFRWRRGELAANSYTILVVYATF